MTNRSSPLDWSFSAGTWFLTRVRISVFFPLLVLVLCYRLGLHLGGLFSLILFFSVLFHEFGHILAARMTGGSGNEILIWPLGGLAFVQPVERFSSQFLTAAAGPLVNLLLCVVTFPAVYASEHTGDALNPFVMPAVALAGEQLFLDVLVLVFVCNWLLLLVNLLPVAPLDGGRMLQACLSLRWNHETTSHIYLRVGFFVAFVLMIVGVAIEDGRWPVIIGAILLCLNMRETFQMQSGEGYYEESFMGYDFSQGYTSLERSASSSSSSSSGPQSESRAGFFKRWLQKRRAAKLQRELEKQKEAEQQLDQLLEKVHLHGMDSLTDAERRLLDRVSARYRGKGKQYEEP